ncbi:hypothetical protein EWM64_g10618 [Hericium alpestre]|uniref:Alpha/beta hydrolase fold-3 domain-containing protein n=1 Tax=Hericium alpestre TaxID=135208 RepID=A0A4Y9ZG47_9AGAM|nr:hypothetical protein EWM64_g10618 [Hericium alpestre]
MSHQYDHLSVIDPEFAEAIKNLPKEEHTEDVAELRRRFDAMINMVNERDKDLFPPASELRIEDHKVPVKGGEITVRTMVPTPGGKSAGGPSPVLVNYHLGGFTVGTLENDKLWLQQICVEQQISVVDVDYRLAPEHPWPTPHEDAFTALKWVAEHPALLRADLSKGFIVTGTSAGGHLTGSMALRARDDPFFEGRRLTGQLLQVPATVHPLHVPEKFKSELRSMDTIDMPGFAEKRLVTMVYGMPEFLKPDPHDPNCWPLLHPNHAGLPPAVFQLCGIDVLRDEGLLYEKLLREAGVKTKLHVYPGVPHGFHMVFTQITQGKKYLQDRKDGIRWLLNGAK